MRSSRVRCWRRRARSAERVAPTSVHGCTGRSIVVTFPSSASASSVRRFSPAVCACPASTMSGKSDQLGCVCSVALSARTVAASSASSAMMAVALPASARASSSAEAQTRVSAIPRSASDTSAPSLPYGARIRTTGSGSDLAALSTRRRRVWRHERGRARQHPLELVEGGTEAQPDRSDEELADRRLVRAAPLLEY